MATATASRTSAKLPESKNVGSALDRALTAGKGVLRLFHSLILNRGVLDGPAGWTYARMLAAYESMVTVHLSRLKNGIDL